MKSDSALTSLGFDKGTAKSIQKHFSEMDQLSQTRAKAFDNIRGLQEQQSQRKSSGLSTSVDVTHDVVNETARSLGMKSADVVRAIESGDNRVRTVADTIAENRFGAHRDNNIPSKEQFKAQYEQAYSYVDPKYVGKFVEQKVGFEEYKQQNSPDHAQKIDDKRDNLEIQYIQGRIDAGIKLGQGKEKIEKVQAQDQQAMQKAKQEYEYSGVSGKAKKMMDKATEKFNWDNNQDKKD